MATLIERNHGDGAQGTVKFLDAAVFLGEDVARIPDAGTAPPSSISSMDIANH